MEHYTRVLICGWNTNSGDPHEILSAEGALVTTPREHERVEAGMAWIYRAEHFLVPSSFSNFLLLVDSGYHLSMRDYGLVSDKGPVKLRLYDSPFFDTNSLGTQLHPRAMNRTVINTPHFQLYGAPFVDVSSLGEEVDFIFMPNSTGNQPFAGGAGAGEGAAPPVEFIIGNGMQTAYMFNIENLSVDTATVQSKFWAYED